MLGNRVAGWTESEFNRQKTPSHSSWIRSRGPGQASASSTCRPPASAVSIGLQPDEADHSARRIRLSDCRNLQARRASPFYCPLGSIGLLIWLSEGLRVHLKLRSHGRGGSLSATCVVILLAVLGLADIGAATGSAGPLRDPWSRGSERFVRKWLLLGPVAAGSAHLDANALQPAPGATQPLSQGITSKWTDYAAYHDTVDLLEVFNRPVSRGRLADPEVAYAYTTIIREHDGDATLSLASDNAVQLWVNGKLVHEQQSDRAFEFDGDQIPVRLAKGENHLLLKFVRVSGPSRFALRVLEPGFVRSRLTEIAPSILQGRRTNWR